MRNIVIGMAMASTMLASPALARDSQWYVQVEGGPMLVEDLDFDVNGVEDQLTQDYDAGYDFGGLVGYDFGPVRIEAEASYREADADKKIRSSNVGNARLAPMPRISYKPCAAACRI